MSSGRERVVRLLEAAREVVHDRAVHAALVAKTGLSPEGVSLALWRYLERSPSDEEVARLVGSAEPAASVRVILSANVLTAPLRALAVACAASDRVSVKPSRRDPVLARELVRRAPELGIALVDDGDVAEVTEGEIHVYGRDETILAVRRRARPGVRVRGHGAGMGVAVVTGAGDLGEAASRVSDDVVVFDQRGCLSPRCALVVGDASKASAFARELDLALSAWATQVPRGLLSEDEAREAARYEATMRFAGRVLRSDGHAVGVAEEAGSLLVPPAGRHVHVMPVPTLRAAGETLASIQRLVVAVGTDDEAGVTEALRLGGDETKGAGLPGSPERGGGAPVVGRRVRVSPLGAMQKPPFDGPVDLRG